MIESRAQLFQHVQKIDDHFYYGRIPEKDLWVVSERIDFMNIGSWLHYAKVQSESPRASDHVSSLRDRNGKALQKGSLFTGSNHFKRVLQELSYQINEVWVAYITKAKFPEKIPGSLHKYNSGNILDGTCPFANNIEMFVSVTTSPNALVTTHMGVARSIEGVLSRKSKGTSVDLHSFAAKIMLIRNPERKYMVNTPVHSMEMIFAKALPNSFYAGTLEMQEEMKQRQAVTKEQFIKKIEQKDKEAMEITRRCDLEERFYLYRTLYHFESATSKETEVEEFLAFMEKHPPILSIKDRQVTIINPHSPSTPVLMIDTKNPTYEWMNAYCFQPSTREIHYIAIDLLALANAKSLAPID
jgi:hypothetical protein